MGKRSASKVHTLTITPLVANIYCYVLTHTIGFFCARPNAKGIYEAFYFVLPRVYVSDYITGPVFIEE